MAEPKKPFVLKWRPPGPVARAYFKSGAFIRGIRGAIGSGKSGTSVVRLFTTALQQEPDRDGRRRTRFAIIRNTYPELTSTTIKTWLDWFPEEVFGPVNWEVPITHSIRLPLPDGTVVESEVIFMAIDRPDQAKKLLSLELTAAFMNEARELAFQVVLDLTGRLGRYPSARDKPEHIAATDWPTQCYLEMDTNSPSDRSWWYDLAESKSKGHVGMAEQLEGIRQELLRMGAIKPDQPLMEFFAQPSGLSPAAENMDNLRPGYYQFSMIGKTEDWIKVHIKNEYGTTFAGKRVYPNYSDALHLAKARMYPVKGLPVCLSFDYGLTPACIIGQLTPRGQLKILAELCSEGMAIRQFMDAMVMPYLQREYPNLVLREQEATGDPAGDPGRDTDGISPADIVSEYFPKYQSARTNDPLRRQEAVNHFLTRSCDGEASFRLSPECATLREGFNGGYHYRKLNSMAERYLEVPEKNGYSHPHDGLQYLAMHYYLPQPKARAQRRDMPRVADRSTGY
ncbi:MAG: hypothetical protein V4772_03295 [Pseudomonadota bacterium]